MYVFIKKLNILNIVHQYVYVDHDNDYNKYHIIDH